MKPLLFLDVDGVINLFGIDAEEDSVLVKHEIRARREDDFTLPLCARPELASQLRRLDELFEVIWCTAWFEGANGILEALGLERRWEVVHWDQWKLPAVVERAGSRRWAFIDDDLAWERRETAKQGFELPASPEHLVVDVNPRVGLDRELMAELERFALAGS